jgi:hypothetical protein
VFKDRKGLFRKKLNPLRCAGANARFWESSRFPCSEVASHITGVAKRPCMRTTLSGEKRSAHPRPAKSAFICVGLEQVTNQRYISPLPTIWSSSQTDVFVAKSAPVLLFVYEPLIIALSRSRRAGTATVASGATPGATAMPKFRIPYYYQGVPGIFG